MKNLYKYTIFFIFSCQSYYDKNMLKAPKCDIVEKGVCCKDAPNYRLVYNGLNVKGKCKSCNYTVISPLKYDATKFDIRASSSQKAKFDINYLQDEFPCSNCTGVIDETEIEVFMFRNCRFRIEGKWRGCQGKKNFEPFDGYHKDGKDDPWREVKGEKIEWNNLTIYVFEL